MGLYKRKDSRFWWMGYTAKGEQRCESTKTSSKELAKKIWKKREAEIALGCFQVGWPGERMTFAELCEEFLHSHSSTLSPKSQENHRIFSKHLRDYFGDLKLTEIDERAVLQSGKPNLSNLAGADACRLKLTSCDKTGQRSFVTFIRLLFANCPLLPRLVLRCYYGSLETREPVSKTGALANS